jgi:hypothetical protein
MTTESPKFQHYISARPTMRMITPKGKPITFIGNTFITDDPEVIEYLDTELRNKALGITKGELMTAEEADPMAALKARIIAEHEEKKEKEAVDIAKGIVPNYSADDKKDAKPVLNTLNSAKLAAISAGSAG